MSVVRHAITKAIAMNQLLLVRHAEPEIDVRQPSSAWHLTSRGADACSKLAGALAPFEPRHLLSSPEPRALETATIISEWLGLTCEHDAHFAEHGVGEDEFIADYREFRKLVQRFFDEPDKVVLRHESAHSCASRFDDGVRALEARDGAAVVVTHGRIMSAWLMESLGQDAWSIWTSLRMPDVLEVDLSAGSVKHVAFDLY